MNNFNRMTNVSSVFYLDDNIKLNTKVSLYARKYSNLIPFFGNGCTKLTLIFSNVSLPEAIVFYYWKVLPFNMLLYEGLKFLIIIFLFRGNRCHCEVRSTKRRCSTNLWPRYLLLLHNTLNQGSFKIIQILVKSSHVFNWVLNSTCCLLQNFCSILPKLYSDLYF